MKKIIPFNNVLEFNTDVKEITAISLEHEIKKYPDMISGTFYISGEYKITEGLLEKEKFNFELPFEIALTNNYDIDTLIVDIDDFRYELISDKSLKVNIDLYLDGEEIELPQPREIDSQKIDVFDEDIYRDNNINNNDSINNTDDINDTDDIIDTSSLKNSQINEEESKKKNINEPILNTDTKLKDDIKSKDNSKLINKDDTLKKYQQVEDTSTNIEKTNVETVKDNSSILDDSRIDLLKEMLTNDKENSMNEESINITNNNELVNNQINELDNDSNDLNFITPDSEEKYVTYRVYKVLETDTLDSILTKYKITKEMLADYNNIESINPGDKLIIPTNEE